MKHFELNHEEVDKLENLHVTVRFDSGKNAIIEKIELIHELFKFPQDITILTMADREGTERLQSILEDWYIGYQFEQMNAPKEYNSGDFGGGDAA